MKMYRVFILAFCCLFGGCMFAATKQLDLKISYKNVNFAGKGGKVIAVNEQFPGPELRFKQGDHVVINVKNNLDTGTSIHWHGVLVPWQMDGVSGVSQQPIPAGGKFTYEFTLEQSGTYWYHSHTGLQEQDGLYGALVIEPLQKPAYKYDKDFFIVLSDWSKTSANMIMRNLESDGMYYSMQKDLHELNDVAYDAFLLNGCDREKPWKTRVKVGDVVRLRFIGAAAMTMFRVKIVDSMMQTVHVQGNDVQQYASEEFVIAPGETQDVIINIKEDKPYIIYAESLDKTGAVYAILQTNEKQKIDTEKINNFTTPINIANKYKNLIAAVATNDPKREIYKTINMQLNGQMHKYIWTIDDETGAQVQPIMLEQNKRYRIIMQNNSMMPHPMHIHGHWFILRNGKGAKDPLLHTVLIAPKEKITVDVDTDASGQWILHCHMLYHMHAGMFRIFQYTTLPEIVAGEIKPENFIEQTMYINRPIVRVDAAQPIDPALVQHPRLL